MVCEFSKGKVRASRRDDARIVLALSLIQNAVTKSEEASQLVHHFFILPALRIVQLTTQLLVVTGSFRVEDTNKNKHLTAKSLVFPGMSRSFTLCRTRVARVLGSGFVGEIDETHGSPRCKIYNGSS
jgi:hypothetical protein